MTWCILDECGDGVALVNHASVYGALWNELRFLLAS